MTPQEHAANVRHQEKELLQLKNDMLVDINTAFQEQNNSQQAELKQLSSQYQFLVTNAGAVITTQGQTIDNLKVEVPALRGVIDDLELKIRELESQLEIKTELNAGLLETISVG